MTACDVIVLGLHLAIWLVKITIRGGEAWVPETRQNNKKNYHPVLTGAIGKELCNNNNNNKQ